MASEIERLREWEDGDSCYRTSCDCMGDDNLTFEIVWDNEYRKVYLEMHADTHFDAHIWDTPTWSRGIRGYWMRVKAAVQILWTGHLKHSAGFIFRGDDHIDAFCDTIQKAKIRCKEKRNG